MDHSKYQQVQSVMTIGYYPIRGKAQVIRLLCQYLHINYKDQFLCPVSWQKFKQNQAKDWVIKELPFLIDKDFSTTGKYACVYYVMEKAGRLDLLGKNIEDVIKIHGLRSKKDCHNALLALAFKCSSGKSVICKIKMKQLWQQKLNPLLQHLEKQSKPDTWHFGYISILDFIIYEVISLLETDFPAEIKLFPKLMSIRHRVYNIPEIYSYENSQRAVKQFKPDHYLWSYMQQKFAEENKKSQMDIE